VKFNPLLLLDHVCIGLDDCTSLQKDPRFRKASMNMKLAFLALNHLHSASLDVISGLSLGCVLATSHGELETSKEFLKTFDQQGVARPILFQNSLHNSTLSFVAQTLAFNGITLTVSHSYLSGEKALEAASLLLDQNIIQACFVLGVDSVVSDLASVYQGLLPSSYTLGRGCGGLLLARLDVLQRIKKMPLGVLKNIDYLPSALEQGSYENYYDSNALECLSKALVQKLEKVYLPKSDGSASLIEWESVSL
jgi:hypothetical protein